MKLKISEVFKAWESEESSIIMQNKICLVPEVPEAKGYLALKYVSKKCSNCSTVVLIQILPVGFRLGS